MFGIKMCRLIIYPHRILAIVAPFTHIALWNKMLTYTYFFV